MPGSFVKLRFEEREFDFVAAPNRTDASWERWKIQGRPVRVETAVVCLVMLAVESYKLRPTHR